MEMFEIRQQPLLIQASSLGQSVENQAVELMILYYTEEPKEAPEGCSAGSHLGSFCCSGANEGPPKQTLDV